MMKQHRSELEGMDANVLLGAPLAFATVAMILLYGHLAVAQQNQPFCLQSNDGALTCHFETMAQCQAALKSGPVRKGNCVPNPKTKP
jgi:hypothetical protein